MNINEICNLIESQPDCEINLKRVMNIVPSVQLYSIESKDIELTTYDMTEIILHLENFMLMVHRDNITIKEVKFNKYTCIYSYIDGQINIKVQK